MEVKLPTGSQRENLFFLINTVTVRMLFDVAQSWLVTFNADSWAYCYFIAQSCLMLTLVVVAVELTKEQRSSFKFKSLRDNCYFENGSIAFLCTLMLYKWCCLVPGRLIFFPLVPTDPPACPDEKRARRRPHPR